VTNFVNVGPFVSLTPVVVTAPEATVEQWEGVLDIGANTPSAAPLWEWHAENWLGQVIVDDVVPLHLGPWQLPYGHRHHGPVSPRSAVRSM